MKSEEMQAYLVDKYLPTIGIECHVQLKTKSKLFTAIENQTDLNQVPNSLTGPLCLGLPGALPVVNRAALDLAIIAGLVLEAEIATKTSFDRKHYFYPDLPLGYQISQHYAPIVGGGKLVIPLSETRILSVRIERAHLEADAGKLTHVKGADYSLVDLNRVGSPLLEIVSRPDMHSPQEAKQYVKELYLRMIHAQICEGDLFAGNLRFDVNVSLSDDPTQLGTRTEIKNLNSFRFVEQASQYEIKRQLEILKSGGQILQETRGWDEESRQTISQRSKEDAQDYRYMPDPDLPPLVIEAAQIERLRRDLPPTLDRLRSILTGWEISFEVRELLLDYPQLADLLISLEDQNNVQVAKLFVNWLASDILALINKKVIDWPIVLAASSNLQVLAKLKLSGKISSTTVKEWLPRVLREQLNPQTLLAETDRTQISDPKILKALVLEIFEAFPQAVEDARQDAKASGFLIGQVIKKTKGSADARLVARIVKELL